MTFTVSRNLPGAACDPDCGSWDHFTFSLTGSNYDPEGGSDRDLFNYSTNDSVTITFASPETNLDLYLAYFRAGTYSIGISGGSGTWAVQSGLGGSTGTALPVSNGAAVVSITSAGNGILRFTGTLTSFTITRTDEPNNYSGQAFTFATIPSAVATPALSEWGMIGLAGLLLLFGALKLRPHRGS